MKFIKKLGVLISLVMVLIVGAVYASWNYSRGELAKTDITFNGRMADIVSGTAKGTIAVVENSNTLTFKVDDTGASDYEAALVPSGQVQIQFKAATGADNKVLTEGIKLQATVTIAGTKTPYAYTPNGETQSQSIVIFAPSTNNSFNLNNGEKVKPNTNVIITAEQIKSAIVFCGGSSVVLDTYEENLAFEQAMGTYTITITISEVAESAQS